MFALALLAHPSGAAAQVQLSPIGSTPTPAPAFSWTASPAAQFYSLWVDDSHEDGRIDLTTITPAAAGCASGSGTCTVSPGVTLAPGLAFWQLGVKTSAGHAWSSEKAFTVPATTDAIAPVVTITGPTTAATYAASSPAVTVSGNASDNIGVTEVTWKNDRGASGTASGTTGWSASLTLQSGSTLFTITARDAANNVATDSVTITYNLSPPPTACPYPTETITTLTPAFCWSATPDAQWYSLWVDDSHEEEKIYLSTISPAAAGCPDGTGQCRITPGVALAPGPGSWTVGVRTGATHSWGVWSPFTIWDPAAPCLRLSPESQWHPADEQTGFIAVTSNGCAWTATTTAAWITLTPGWTSGIGNGRVRYDLSANTTGASREADIMIGPVAHHVTQYPLTTCGVALSGYRDLYDANAHVESISLSVGASCAWTAVSNVGWVVLRNDSRSGTGPATIRWDVAANTSTSGRSGTLTIGGRTYAVEQHAATTDDPCGAVVTPLTMTVSSEEAAYHGTVSTAAGCSWTTTSLSPFIDVTGGFSGSGSGTVSFLVHGTMAAEARTGTLDVAGHPVLITQAGTAGGNCTYSFSSPDPLPPGVTTGSVSVSAPSGCAWSATTESDFLSITGDASGSGSGSVRFSTGSNDLHESRLGALMIGGQELGVMQLGAAGEPTCVTSVTPTTITAPAIGSAGTIAVSTTPNCVWSVAPGAPWITLSGTTTRTGPGSVSYQLAVNAGEARGVSLHVGDQELTIEQDGAVPTGTGASEIVWPAPEPKKANDCYGNCGGGCGTFVAVCGTNGGNWTSEVRSELQHVDDQLLEVCSAGTWQLGVFPRYAATVRWTYHGVESPACLAHDSLCRSWAGKLPLGLGKAFCAVTAIGPYIYTICESARPWTWSYEETEIGRTMFPTAIVGNPDARPCIQEL